MGKLFTVEAPRWQTSPSLLHQQFPLDAFIMKWQEWKLCSVEVSSFKQLRDDSFFSQFPSSIEAAQEMRENLSLFGILLRSFINMVFVFLLRKRFRLNFKLLEKDCYRLGLFLWGFLFVCLTILLRRLRLNWRLFLFNPLIGALSIPRNYEQNFASSENWSGKYIWAQNVPSIHWSEKNYEKVFTKSFQFQYLTCQQRAPELLQLVLDSTTNIN